MAHQVPPPVPPAGHTPAEVTTSKAGYKDAEARWRYFSADILRDPKSTLHIHVAPAMEGLELVLIDQNSPVVEWNRKYAGTFPEDALKQQDLIVKVNGVGIDETQTEVAERTKPLLHALQQPDRQDLLLIVRRDEKASRR